MRRLEDAVFAMKTRKLAVSADQGAMGHVASGAAIAEHPQGDGVEPAQVTLRQQLEGSPVARVRP